MSLEELRPAHSVILAGAHADYLIEGWKLIRRLLNKEGSWPVGSLDTIWAATGTIQRRGNVWLVQNALPCTPSQIGGCERPLDSYRQ
jgi:hypothetical protein